MRKLCTFGVLLCLGFALLSKQTTVHNLADYESETITIEVKGEVVNPGTYEMSWYATMKDGIEKAGGVSEDANLDSLNLNEELTNRMVIVIPKKSVETCISLNSATVEELDTLPGIGPAVAQRILAYRTSSSFQTIEEIKEVKGIGDKLFEKIRERICL